MDKLFLLGTDRKTYMVDTPPTKMSQLINDEGLATETYVNTQVDKKVDKITGKGLSTNDYTNEDKSKLANTNIAYGTCSTAADVAEKVVVLNGNTQWSLTNGSIIMVKFDVSNSAEGVTINVNNTGAYPIWYNASEYTSSGTAYTGYANRTITYMFNGTHWVWITSSYDANSTYSNAALGQGYATCSTAAATAAKVGSLSSYKLTTGGIVSVKFTNAVPANATLNINSTGAKNMYFRGAKITADVIKAGDVATFVYSSYYHLISIDRWQNDISSVQDKINGLATTDEIVAEAKAAMSEDLAAKSDIYSDWENVDFSAIKGKVMMNANREIVSLANAQYLEVVVNQYKQLKVTGYQWASGYSLCVFYDEAQTRLSTVVLTTGTQYTDYLVDVPANAFTVVVNGHINNAINLKGLRVYDCKTLSAEKANRIAKWVTPSVSITQGSIITSNGLGTQANNNGEIGVVDIGGYQKVVVAGWQYGISYGFDVCYFYDADGNVLSYHQGTVEGKKTVMTLDVPQNAVTLKINGHKYEGNVSVSAYRVFDVDDLYNELRPNGKKLITLGDSITALGTGQTGWVKYFIEKTGCELVANVAVNGATLMDKSGTTYDGNPVFNGSDNNVNNVLGNQVQKIIDNNYTAPDIIIIAIGTNGGISITKDEIKAAYYDSSNALIPLSNVDRTTSAGAYRWCLEKLHEKYPNALIFWCTPIMGYQTTRSAENAMAYAESLRIATEYTGQMMIDTIRCGINGVNEKSGANGQYLVDGLHPNANGAKKIGYYNAAKVIPFLGSGFTLI